MHKLMLRKLINYFIQSIIWVTTISRPTERMSYATCKSGCQLKRSIDVAQFRVINVLIPLMSRAPVAQWVKRWPTDLADRVRSALEVKSSHP